MRSVVVIQGGPLNPGPIFFEPDIGLDRKG
jgi:hypothetical protein